MRKGLTVAASLVAALPAMPAVAAEPTPTAFVEAAAAEPRRPAEDRWWTIFRDRQLDTLIERGIRENAEVAVAAARLSQARAVLREAKAERSPRVSVIAGVADQSGTLVTASGDSGSLFELGARASWEPDLTGRLGKAARAARLDVRAAAERAEQVKLVTASEIASTYFALRNLDADRAATAAAEDAAGQTRAILEAQARTGSIGTVERARRLTELSALRSERLAIEREHAATRHALALLVGTERLPELTRGGGDPAAPAIPAGLPSTMLTRRPDIAAAVDAIEAARLRRRAAKADWFPRFELTGNGGQASTALAGLLGDAARTFGLNLLLSLPIFDGGRNKARQLRAAADVELAVAQHRAGMLGAFREVEDALSDIRLLGDEENVARADADTLARARAVAARRFDAGAISRLELLAATRADLAAERRASRLRYARAIAAVALIRALGGGWGDGVPPPLDLAARDRH